jgi:hypothetical protein
MAATHNIRDFAGAAALRVTVVIPAAFLKMVGEP